MIIKKLIVSNFRSIDHAEIDFSPLSIIVGANASGKSNLINVFRFIRDIITEGIDNAIALQGGTTYLSNVRSSKGTPIDISLDLDLSDEEWYYGFSSNKKYTSRIKKISYHFSILPHKKGNGYRIGEDHLSLTTDFYLMDSAASGKDRIKPLNIGYTAEYYKKSVNSSYQYQSSADSIDDNEIQKYISHDIASKMFLQFANADKKELMLNRISLLLPPIFSDSGFIRIFDFDPKRLKKASSMASIKTLSENGSNLASVLHEIIRKKDKKEKLTTLLKQYLPYVTGLSVESNIDKSFSYKISESFSKRTFHASFLSDGTVSVLALIIALHFEERSHIIILEEPERNIHPKLLVNLLESAEDVSKEKQIIITTHNPEFLKHAKIENVRLVSRDKQGNSIVTEPANNNIVKEFMNNDLGLDDLFLQNMLGD